MGSQAYNFDQFIMNKIYDPTVFGQISILFNRFHSSRKVHISKQVVKCTLSWLIRVIMTFSCNSTGSPKLCRVNESFESILNLILNSSLMIDIVFTLVQVVLGPVAELFHNLKWKFSILARLENLLLRSFAEHRGRRFL